MSLYYQEGIVNTVETPVNASLKLYGGRRREGGMEISDKRSVEGLSVVVLVARATSRK